MNSISKICTRYFECLITITGNLTNILESKLLPDPRGTYVVRRLARIVPLVILLNVAPASFPLAQQNVVEFEAVMHRLDRLDRDMSGVQRRLGVEGEANIAARSTGNVESIYSVLAHQELRLNEIEEQLFALTGQFERTQHNLGLVLDRMNSLSEEVMARFDGIEGHLSALRVGRSAPTLSANGPIVETAPVVRSDVGDGNSRPVAVDQDPNVEHYETMGVLGEISSEGKAEKGGRENVVAAVMLSVDQNPNSSLTPEESYDAAYQLLRRADYGQAELALRVFIENYPDHELSGNAFYWLGETFYVRDDYENAKRAFAQGYKKFPTGPKAPDILLKLGMSFRGAMDDANACVIFKELNDDHPNAPAVIITRLEQERAKAGCQ
ncbi:MAG: hypothetical protein CFH35_00997 [Alphaproteobacteria bacterium MarineAlpha9_Bin5]|nr:MAG: hypothetical protein CFH36_00358 [Alphaproteobacteria bacterium MarineAlpha9_Bin6]PPR38683.1 MAG: hypothetical protein CFH35_00997 [Alphaproteobacteria bacterium MarineAlpha9_Bin5]